MDGIRQKIILVDDNITNLALGRKILKDHYETYPAPSAAKLFEILENVRPDLILLDILMPEMNGYETIKKLKADPRFSDIPVIFITAMSDEIDRQEGFSLGAVDYIAKPFSMPLLLERIEKLFG
jgi:putative two-component system response regulator